MKEGRWTEVTQSEFPWEQQALSYLRERLPDAEPFRAWANFEFIANDGSINEVDLLVVSTSAVFLVEIKSSPGLLTGDAGTWKWHVDGRDRWYDNPRILANRKAKKLKFLLKKGFKERMPFFEAVVFLSNQELKCDLEPSATHGVYVSESHPQSKEFSSIIDVLTGQFDAPRHDRVTPSLSKAIARQVDKAGIRPTTKFLKVNDYRLEKLVTDTELYQDWIAKHEALANMRRIVRLYPIRPGASKTEEAERRKAAEREFRFLDGANHDGLLGVRQFANTERGPAVLFEYDPEFQRLDFFLKEHGESLSLDDRLRLVRQLAETLQYAHSRHMYHCTLNPRSVLVKDSGGRHQTKIFNWNTARKEGTDIASGLTLGHTAIVELAGGAATGAYLAPEFSMTGDSRPEALDVFSLGALTYHIVSGHRPAADSTELEARLAGGLGLSISSVMDGAPESLEELVQLATDPDVGGRPDSIAEFLALLDDVEDDMTRPEEEPSAHPLDAKRDDVLPGGFKVIRRLGKGATAVALLVARDGEESVLKVALSDDKNDRLRREGEVLDTLRHQNVVEYFETLDLAGHTTLRLAKAGADTKTGTYTLAQRLREEGRLSLDLLQRFGDELLGVVDWLESQGVSHRDIKPDNIGVSSTRAKKALTLVLFDFSLAGTPAENITAGTPPYLDPFLKTRKSPKWDPSAERFAAAMTLYEMATGQLPTWGDGQSHPAMLDCEATLDNELFDASVRDGLERFFKKALARDYRKRFDNAEEMRRAWFRVFQKIDLPVTTTHSEEGGPEKLGELLTEANEDSTLASLGLTARLLDALDRIGVYTIGDLLALPRIRLYRNKGIGNKLVRKIRELAEDAAQAFAERGKAPPKIEVAESEPQSWNLSQLDRKLVGEQVAADQAAALNTLLGRDGKTAGGAFPPLRDAAKRLGIQGRVMREHLAAARQRWLKQPWMTTVRDELAALLEQNGGVMTLEEATAALLARRGAERDADRERVRYSVTRAAVETESGRQDARFTLHRGESRVLLTATEHLGESFAANAAARAAYALALGSACDELASLDPLAPPVRALDSLRAISAPDGDPPMTPARLLRLGVSASQSAALSSRQEIYPVGMSAERALKLGMGSLLGPKQLSVSQIKERIHSRYPEAEPLPDRPPLDDLLESAGLSLRWEAVDNVYRPTFKSSVTDSSASFDRIGLVTEREAAEEAAAEIDRRIALILKSGGFLLLSAPPKYLARAEAALMAGYELKQISLEAALVSAMKEEVSRANANWDVVVRADAAERGSRDWRRLVEIARRAATRVAESLFQSAGPLLLLRAGLLARYGQLDLLNKLGERCQSDRGAAACLVLVPGDRQGTLPAVDGVPIPVVLTSQFVRLSPAWLQQRTDAPVKRKTAT